MRTRASTFSRSMLHNRSVSLNPMAPRSEPSSEGVGAVGWFLAGLLLAIVILVAQTKAIGGDAAQLLAAGHGPLSDKLTAELPGVSWDPNFIHDGHRYYAMALDLGGQSVAEGIEDAVYWYQRILYPLLASGFGAFRGRMLLHSMMTIAVIAFAWTTVVVYLIGREKRLPWLIPLAHLANVGAILSVSLLTSDTLAAALFFTSLWLWMKDRHRLAAVIFVLAILSKEVFALPVVALGLYEFLAKRRRRSILYLMAPLPALLWRIMLMTRFEPYAGGDGSLSLPGIGLAQATTVWPTVGPRDMFFTAIALLTLGLGAWLVLSGRSLFRWLAAAWVAIGLIGSHLVWDYGNNAARVLAPLFTIAVLGIVMDRYQPSDDALRGV